MKYKKTADIYINTILEFQKGSRDGCTGEAVSDEIMEDNRAEQIEALQVLEEFNGRLVKNMEIIVKELSGERLDDTDSF